MLKVAWTKNYKHALPQGHRFPMEKYDLLPEQLVHEGTLVQDNFFAPGPLKKAHILAVHTSTYWEDLRELRLSPKEQRKTGFPLSEELVNREIIIGEGTRLAAKYALEFGAAMNIAGGTHHAFTNRGEGFCLLNDIAMASIFLLEHEGLSKILVVDLDVHQGNGTAEIFKEDPRVFTFSMHGKNNYPLQKEISDLDLPMEDGADDQVYLKNLKSTLPRLLDEQEPDFIFFQSGVDVLATDKLGRLGMTIDGCKERDRTVLELAKRDGIPIVACMGGGYSEKLSDIVEAHANTYRLAQEIFF